MRLRWLLLLIVTVALFYWKILFTKQFSVLWLWESVSQSYGWYHFAASEIQRGVLPIWDPYRFSGSTFIGEMQTGLFYPLKFFAYLMPFGDNGLLSERVYHQVYVLNHLLAAIFMFLLGRYLRLSSFASFVAGLTFALGGYVANTGHPHTLDSAIWLPLIVLFFLRSVDENSLPRTALFAALAGIGLGMAVLGGGLHMVIMDGIVIGTLSLVFCFSPGHRSARILTIAAGVFVVGFLFGGVQLLPSMEYSSLSFRWIGSETPIQSLQKVPYLYVGDARHSPHSLFAFLFGFAYTGDVAPSNYLGVIPFFMSIIGAWKNWHTRLVRYFTALGILAFLYAWGGLSFLHGVLYLLPILDMAREASRFVHIAQFAMAILAGYGIHCLFSTQISANDRIWVFVRGVRWLVVLLAVLLIAANIQTTIAVNEWLSLSFVFIGGTYVLLELICRQSRSVPVQISLVFLLLWDLYAYNWIIRNKAVAQAENQEHLGDLMNRRKLAEFLKSDGSVFRIHFDGEFPPNIGDVYGVEMTGGMSATMLKDYVVHLGHPKMPELLNVRYTIKRSDAPDDRTPIFSDGLWNVYENAGFGSRAWVVHRIELDSSSERPLPGLAHPDFDPKRVAILEQVPEQPIDAQAEAPKSQVESIRRESQSLELRVRAQGRGFLVVSEVFYPGWRAFVNDRAVAIHRVNGFLRGVSVPDGESTVRFEYRPGSLMAGAALTLSALLGTAGLGLWAFRSSRQQKAVLNSMRQDWDDRARKNARYYVATEREEWTDEEFFESGRTWVNDFIVPDLPGICNGRPPSEMRILEIGCGAGRMTRPLSEIFGTVDGVDVSAEMVSQARAAMADRSNVRLHVNNGVDLSIFEDEQFDFAVSVIVFQHIPKRVIVENYIAEVARVLKRNSLFKFQVQGYPVNEMETDTWVGVGFSEEQIHMLAARLGFQIKASHGAGTQYYWLTFYKP